MTLGHRIPETNCLVCRQVLTGISATEGDAKPKPGDPVACINCGAVCTVDDFGDLRPFTEAEAKVLREDDEWMAQVRKLVGVIQIVNAVKN